MERKTLIKIIIGVLSVIIITTVTLLVVVNQEEPETVVGPLLESSKNEITNENQKENELQEKEPQEKEPQKSEQQESLPQENEPQENEQQENELQVSEPQEEKPQASESQENDSQEEKPVQQESEPQNNIYEDYNDYEDPEILEEKEIEEEIQAEKQEENYEEDFEYPEENREILPERIELSKDNITLDITSNNEECIKAKVIPEDSNTQNNIVWINENQDIVQVDSEGNIRGLKNGNATVKAITENGVESTCEISVCTSAEKVSLNIKNALLENNHKGRLQAKVEPSTANMNTNVQWQSSNEEIATVSSEGIIEAHQEGKVTITATVENGLEDSCEVIIKPENIFPEGINLNKRHITLDKNIESQEQLIAKIEPENTNIQNEITWKSSNEEIATVDKDGTITGISNGTAIITAQTGNGKQATCEVDIETSPSKVLLNKEATNIQININPQEQLRAIIEPQDVNIEQKLMWKSSNEEIVTVTQDGLVNVKKEGKAKITVTTENGKQATCIVTSSIKIIPPEELKLGKDQIILDLSNNNTELLRATIEPQNSNIQNKITWTSDDEKVAIVDQDGLITGISNGEATITAQTENGKETSCDVTVQTSVKKVSLNISNASIQKNHEGKLIATIEPKTANVGTKIEWKSSDEKIATINEEGIIKALQLGKVTLTAQTENGKKATCELIVKQEEIEPTSISLNKTKIVLDIKGTNQDTLIATVEPKNSNKFNKITWTSSDNNIAKVDEKGTIIAVNNGTATITAKTENGKTANCEVVVQTSPEGISLNQTVLNLKLEVNATANLTATLQPSTVNVNNDIKWTSSNTNVATVKNGVITAKAEGSAIITATTGNGKQVTCTVKVAENTVIKKLDGKNVELPVGDKVYFLDTCGSKKKNTKSGTDCFIIESNGKYGMIDTATEDKANQVVVNYLKELKIKELEFVLISHAHGDHTGGYGVIDKAVKIKKLYIKNVDRNEAKVVINIAKANKTTKIKYVTSEKNNQIKLGNITFKLFNTTDLKKDQKTNINENVNSITALANINGKAVYFTGDIGNYDLGAENKVAKEVAKELKAMGKDSIDVYKAAHHSYNHNNSATALKYLKPKNVIITNTKFEAKGRIESINRLKAYVEKANGKLYYLAQGTVVLNVSKDGTMKFKKLPNYYS